MLRQMIGEGQSGVRFDCPHCHAPIWLRGDIALTPGHVAGNLYYCPSCAAKIALSMICAVLAPKGESSQPETGDVRE